MTDHLALAIRRAQWAKDAPQQERKTAPVKPEPVPEPSPSPPPRVELVTPLVKRHPMEVVQRAVAAAYGLELAALIGRQRKVKFVHPRQIAMFICWELRLGTLTPIGRRFKRDHTTVLHAIRQVEKMRRVDLAFEFKLQKMIDDLRGVLT
jgi:hypothetical protein